MRKRTRLTIKAFIPAGGPLTLGVVGLLLLLAGTGIAVAYGASYTTWVEQLSNGAFILGFMALPLAAVLQLLGGLWEKQPPAKLTLGCLTELLLACAAALVLVSFLPAPAGGLQTTGVLIVILFFAPAIFVVAALPIYALTKTPAALRELVGRAQTAAVLDLLHVRGGAVNYGEVAALLEISKPEAERFLHRLVQNKRVLGVFEERYELFFSLPTYLERQTQFRGLLASHGQLALDTLVRELALPKPLVKEWIYALMQKDNFSGYINWQEEMIYSADAEYLQGGRRCPNCGGALELAGKGIIHCGNCGAEIFLPAKKPTGQGKNL